MTPEGGYRRADDRVPDNMTTLYYWQDAYWLRGRR
jgi:hypothetical protein